ncbi:hypothetical protein [Bosea sp. 124]|uniref:hypothetical protein n=1 Tax=Bosea sp. 124 TaxID=2135642 RepID=UPI000D362EE6|nr:hypothetical protein [Bosea sp. 124]PTM38915.1 hypothetical protein C8D03_0390 [Bosea sp. 124]
MSTIAARAHSGSSLSAPLRRPASQPRHKTTWFGRVVRLAARRPGRAFVLLVFAAVSAAILANALILQKARHPAPMVSAPSQTPPARQAERRAEQPAASASATMTPTPAPLPPSRPNDLSQQARDPVVRPPAAVTSIPRTAAAPAPAPVARSAAAPRDPIADLINGADIRPPAEVRGVAQARSATPRRSAEN